MEHLELRTEELKLMEARERFRREHESELSELLRSEANPRRAFGAFLRDLWSNAKHDAAPAASDDASALATE